MNTIRSTWYGWATLCVAGGGAYYFAKKQINADRADRYSKERQMQERLHRLEVASQKKSLAKQQSAMDSYVEHDPRNNHDSYTPESDDPSPAAQSEIRNAAQRERSQYEAAQLYKSKKGDRFS